MAYEFTVYTQRDGHGEIERGVFNDDDQARAAIYALGGSPKDTAMVPGEIDGQPDTLVYNLPGGEIAWIETDIPTHFVTGDRVEAGTNAQDYDTGRVVATDGERITVAWDSGVRTTQRFDALRPEGARPIAAE